MNWKNAIRLKWPVLILLLVWSFSANAQIKRENRGGNEERPRDGQKDTAGSLAQESFWKRLTFGGSGGAMFGSYTYVDVSPLVGYRITDDFTAGLGSTYQYFRDKTPGFPTYEASIYGGRAFAQHAFLKNFLIYGEYGLINYPSIDIYTGDITRRTWVAMPLLGGGIRQKVGQRSYLQLLALYNFNQDRRFTGNPLIIRVGFML